MNNEPGTGIESSDTELGTLRLATTSVAVLTAIVVTYSVNGYHGAFAELFKGMNLELSAAGKLMMSGIGNWVAPILGLASAGLYFDKNVARAIRAQSLLTLCMFGFALSIIHSVISQILELYRSVGP